RLFLPRWDAVKATVVPQVRQERYELGSAPRTSALDRPRRHAEHRCCLLHRIPLNVNEHESRALVVGKRLQCPLDLPRELAAAERVARLDRVRAVVLGQWD